MEVLEERINRYYTQLVNEIDAKVVQLSSKHLHEEATLIRINESRSRFVEELRGNQALNLERLDEYANPPEAATDADLLKNFCFFIDKDSVLFVEDNDPAPLGYLIVLTGFLTRTELLICKEMMRSYGEQIKLDPVNNSFFNFYKNDEEESENQQRPSMLITNDLFKTHTDFIVNTSLDSLFRIEDLAFQNLRRLESIRPEAAFLFKQVQRLHLFFDGSNHPQQSTHSILDISDVSRTISEFERNNDAATGLGFISLTCLCVSVRTDKFRELEDKRVIWAEFDKCKLELTDYDCLSGLTHLEELNLINSCVATSRMPTGCLGHMRALNKLEIKHDRLETVSCVLGSATASNKLETLDLGFNRIEAIESDAWTKGYLFLMIFF
jgi:hypothetical protein